MSSLQPVKAESLSSQVADQIRQAIFNGELKSGEFLRELALAKNFQVSQATVREALTQLEQYGLVVRTPNRNTTVTSIGETDAKERLRIRLALEELAFAEAASRATPEELDELAEIANQVEDLIESDAGYELVRLDQKFHQRVWQLTQNQTLYRMLDQLTTPLFAFLRLYQQGVGNGPDAIVSHPKLVEALRSGDRNRIVLAVRGHIGVTHSALFQSNPAGINGAAQAATAQEAAHQS